MGLSVDESLKILKPMRAKLVKKVSPDWQSEWDAFLKATDEAIAELEKIAGSGFGKARADYDAKKKELEALKAKLNASAGNSKASLSKAIAARRKAEGHMANLGRLTKGKEQDPTFKQYREGFMLANHMNGRFPDGGQLEEVQ